VPTADEEGFSLEAMRKFGPLIVASAAASLTYLVTRPLALGDWPAVFAVLSTLLLAVQGFRLDRLLGWAIAFSCLGDFLLGIRQLGNLNADSLFLFGLGSFLLAHLTYIGMFRKYRLAMWWKPGPLRLLGVLTILVVLGSMLEVLRHSLGPLLIPVVFYSLVLSGMGISAMLADLDTPLAGIGALLFISSDAMLAISKFRGPFAGSGPLIWITYYSAQLVILLGFAHRSHGSRR